MNKYTKFSYLWPPRPSNALPKLFMKRFQKKGWCAQIKLNGTCTIVAVSPEKEVIYMNRYEGEHKQWKPNTAINEWFENLPGNGWYYFVGELLNNKVADDEYKNIISLFDILVHNGEQLVGKTFNERHQLLNSLSNATNETWFARKFSNNVWCIKNVVNWTDVWNKIRGDEPFDGGELFEGLVLKDPSAKLEYCFKSNANQNWQVKIRRPHKNHGF